MNTIQGYRLIRLALMDARDSIEHYRATGETRRHHSPLPQHRWLNLYNKAYNHGLRVFS